MCFDHRSTKTVSYDYLIGSLWSIRYGYVLTRLPTAVMIVNYLLFLLACHTTGLSTTLNPIREQGGILLLCYSMIIVYGLTVFNFQVRSEDRSPSLIPAPGITLIKQPPVSKLHSNIWIFDSKLSQLMYFYNTKGLLWGNFCRFILFCG